MSFFAIRLGNSELGWLELSSCFSVGRNPMCDLVLQDTLLSRRHFQVEFDGENWFVHDMGSKNGTWREDLALSREILNEGDVIRAGHYSFEFHERIPEGAKKYSPSRITRPADPHEALQGTIHGLVYDNADAQDAPVASIQRQRPRPIPRPFRSVGLLEEPQTQLQNAENQPRHKLPIMLELPDDYDLQPTGETLRRPPAPGPASAPASNKRWWNDWKISLNIDLAVFLLILALLAAGLYAILAYIPHW